MANLKEISRQISSVSNTQKTTKAMKLVSTAKLRRAQLVRAEAEAYSIKINEVLHEISSIKNDTEKLSLDRMFIQNDNPKNVDIIVVTADKGLCGGFNHSSISNAMKLKKEHEEKGANVRLISCGKKGSEFFTFNKIEMLKQSVSLSSAPTYELASEFVKDIFSDFYSKKTDKVIFVYNGFKNMLAQDARIHTILPVEIKKFKNKNHHYESSLSTEEDHDDKLLITLTDKYVIFNFYYGLLDSLAAEHSARMQAMDNAVKNAEEKKNELTVFYNKTRQAAITTELVEIISGVESLK